VNRLEESIFSALIADESLPPAGITYEEATTHDAQTAARVARHYLRRRDTIWGCITGTLLVGSIGVMALHTPTTVVQERTVTINDASCLKAIDDMNLLLSYVTDALSQVDAMSAAQASAQIAVINRDKAALREAWTAMDEAENKVSNLADAGQSIAIGTSADECRGKQWVR
jgi:hypothetical protein